MSVLRIIKPWIRQYLNDHLIDHCVDLIEEQLIVEKSIQLEKLIEWHNLKVGSVFRTLVQELELHLPADFFTVTDDSSSLQRTKKELKRLQKQLLRTSNDEKEKTEISTQTENRIGLQVKPLHELSNNVSPELLVGHLSETPNKKQKKNKKENSDRACSPAVEPLDNFAGEEREEQEKSKKKKKKKEELVNSNNQTNISLDHLNNDEKKLMIMRDLLLKLAELLSDENRIEFEEYFRQKMSNSSKGDSKGECESEENILNSDHRKSKKRKKRNSDVVQIVSEANPDILETEETRKKKKKKKRKSEGEDGPIITHIGSVNSLPEPDNLRDTSKNSSVPTDKFHHELNPSYDSQSDSNQGNSPIILSHVMGSDVAVKTELSFLDEGPSNSAHPVKQVEYVPVPESSCALNVSNITCKSNPLHESLNIPESSSGRNRAKDTGDNLEKELLELEQCLQQVNKETDNQEPKEGSSASITNPTLFTSNSVSSQEHRVTTNSSGNRNIIGREEIEKKIECYKCGEKFSSKAEIYQHWIKHVKDSILRSNVQQASANNIEENLRENSHNLPDVCPKLTDLKRSPKSPSGSSQSESIPRKNILYASQSSQTQVAPIVQSHLIANPIKNKRSAVDRRSSSNLPFKCSVCSLVFRNRTNLSKHLQKHTRTLKCSTCSISFKTVAGLQKHHKIKHPAAHSVEKHFNCSKCPSSFKNDVSLQKHLVSHSNDKPFKCNLCPTFFKRKSDMNFHLATKHSIQRFFCSACKKPFQFRRDLITHRKEAHATSKISLKGNVGRN